MTFIQTLEYFVHTNNFLFILNILLLKWDCERMYTSLMINCNIILITPTTRAKEIFTRKINIKKKRRWLLTYWRQMEFSGV